MAQYMLDVTPDNREVFVSVANTSVTFYCFTSAGTTSAGDTTTSKYFNTNSVRVRYVVTSDQDIQITHVNGTELTDPRSIDANKTFSESEVPAMSNITIKTLAANATVKLFVR